MGSVRRLVLSQGGSGNLSQWPPRRASQAGPAGAVCKVWGTMERRCLLRVGPGNLQVLKQRGGWDRTPGPSRAQSILVVCKDGKQQAECEV